MIADVNVSCPHQLALQHSAKANRSAREQGSKMDFMEEDVCELLGYGTLPNPFWRSRHRLKPLTG